jgi:AcrR family transcriptional regulator
MRQIAQAAGVAVGGIYNHFASKDEVFAAVLDAHHPYHALVPALLATEGETLEEFVYDAGRRIQEAVKGVEDQLLPIIFIELVEFQGRHLKAIVERLYPTIMGFAQRLAERRGPLRDVPVPVLMRSLVALTIGHIMTDMILRSAAPFQQMHYDWYGSLLEIYLHGVLAPGAAEA